MPGKKIGAHDGQTIRTPDSHTGKPRSTAGSTAGLRFEKRHRLPDKAAFDHVFEGALRSRDRLFTVLSRRNPGEAARLGLAISKKACRLATTRNRVKRIVRESFRQHLATLAGLDVVVLAQSGAAQADNRALFDSLSKHWQKARSAQLGGHSDSQ